MSESDAECGVPLIEPEFSSTSSLKKKKNKRRREVVDDDDDDAKTNDSARKAARKARRKEKKKQKAKEIDEEDLDQALCVNHSFERMDSQLLADYINARTRLYGQDVMSSVELEDRFISPRQIQDTTTTTTTTTHWTAPRTAPNLSAFLHHHHHHSGLLEPTRDGQTRPGSPHTLIVTASAIRAAELCRHLKSEPLPPPPPPPQQGTQSTSSLRSPPPSRPRVAKLFAKHLKLADQVAHLQKNKIEFGVGTPDRLTALLDAKALLTADLRRVVIDVSYIDQKKRGILDMRELHESLLTFLRRRELSEVQERKQEQKQEQDEGKGLFLFF